MTFGGTLRQLRKAKKMSQQDVAHLLGINRTTYTKYETGKSEPDVSTICHLAEIFAVSTDELLNFNGPGFIPPTDQSSTAVEEPLSYLTEKDLIDNHHKALHMKAALMNIIGLAFEGQPQNQETLNLIMNAIEKSAELAKSEMKEKYMAKK